MDDLLDLRSAFGDDDEVHLLVLRKLMSYPYINFISRYFTEMREYEAGVRFAEHCLGIISRHEAEIAPGELEQWTKYFNSQHNVCSNYIAKGKPPLTPVQRAKHQSEMEWLLGYMKKIEGKY